MPVHPGRERDGAEQSRLRAGKGRRSEPPGLGFRLFDNGREPMGIPAQKAVLRRQASEAFCEKLAVGAGLAGLA